MIAQPVPLKTSPAISKVPEPMRSTMKPAGVCNVADKKPETAMAKPSLDDYRAVCDQHTLDLVASFQRTMVRDLVEKTLAAAHEYNVATLFVTGGVAANNELRQTFEQEGARAGLPVYFPSRPLSTDNAAMIAAAAYPKYLAGDFAPPDFSAEAGMRLK